MQNWISSDISTAGGLTIEGITILNSHHDLWLFKSIWVMLLKVVRWIFFTQGGFILQRDNCAETCPCREQAIFS